MESLKATTVGEFFLRSAQKTPSQNFIRHAYGYHLTYAEAFQKVASLVQFFKDQGIQKGDRVVLYWEDTLSGLFFALACAISGVVLVPLSPIFSIHYLKNLMAQCGAKAVFTTLDRISALQEAELEPYSNTDLLDLGEFSTSGSSLENLKIAKFSPGEAEKFLWSTVEGVHPSDVFMIQPTSGSTGQPKLVLRTHISPGRYAKFVGPEIHHENEVRPRFLMVAALTHAFGFNMLTTALSLGAELLIPSRIDAASSLAEVRELDPTVIPLVPRILRSYFLQKEKHFPKDDPRIFGPGAQFLISAGGSGDPSYFQTLYDQGIKIMELYGSSEASMISMTPRDGWRPGFAGKVLPDVELKVEEDGEFLIRSPGMMLGYMDDQAGTKEAFNEEGYYRSGDLGRVDSQGYLQILGRKKDIFNTAEGSNIYPERIENLLETLPSVKQAVLLGDRRPFISALLVIQRENVPELSNLPPMEDLEETRFKTVYKRIGFELRRINSQLERVEQIVRFTLLDKPFSPEVYTTVGPGKARRNRAKVNEIYSSKIEALYHATKEIDTTFVPGMDRRMRPHSDLRVHLIWLSKDHLCVIKREIGEKIKPMIKEICSHMNVRVLSGNIAANYVHLFISYPPELSVAEIVSNLKRITSNKIFHILPIIQESLQGKNLWDQGYLAVTSGNLEGDILQRYVADEEGLPDELNPIQAESIILPLEEMGLS